MKLKLKLASVLGVFAMAALATSGAHFFQDTTASVADNGALVLHIDEAGVGQQQVNYSVSALASATYACINNGGNHPKAANKETVSSSLATGFAETPQNGRVDVTTTLNGTPIGPGNFSCPAGQTLVLENVSYTNIVLSDLTNGVTTDLPSVERTFATF